MSIEFILAIIFTCLGSIQFGWFAYLRLTKDDMLRHIIPCGSSIIGDVFFYSLFYGIFFYFDLQWMLVVTTIFLVIYSAFVVWDVLAGRWYYVPFRDALRILTFRMNAYEYCYERSRSC